MGEEVGRGPINRTGAANTNPKKRKGTPEGDDGGTKRSRPDGNRVWACPFFKRDPNQYEECRYRKLSRNCDVTQHVSRTHQQPIHCPICSETFPGDSQLRAHVKERNCEEPETPFSHVGATLDQMREIKREIKGDLDTDVPEAKTKDEKKWYARYAILFGNEAPRPATPYLSRLEGDMDTAKRLCDVIQSFRDEHHPELFAQSTAPSDKLLPDRLHQFLDRLKRYILDPPLPPQRGARVGSAPATGPGNLDHPASAAPPSGPSQHPPYWPNTLPYGVHYDAPISGDFAFDQTHMLSEEPHFFQHPASHADPPHSDTPADQDDWLGAEPLLDDPQGFSGIENQGT